jgi:hypothetical protein
MSLALPEKSPRIVEHAFGSEQKLAKKTPPIEALKGRPVGAENGSVLPM